MINMEPEHNNSNNQIQCAHDDINTIQSSTNPTSSNILNTRTSDKRTIADNKHKSISKPNTKNKPTKRKLGPEDEYYPPKKQK